MNTAKNLQEAFATNEQWNKAIAEKVTAETGSLARRSHPRYTADGEIRVRGQVDDKPVNDTWKLSQVSVEGLTARSFRQIPEGARLNLDVHINGQTLHVRGKVRHCTQTVGGYKVGVQLFFDE
jgi:hypothetical protein